MNKKISDYMVLSGKDEATLEGLVRMHLREGWMPIGGVSFKYLPLDGGALKVSSFIQAMVKYEE